MAFSYDCLEFFHWFRTPLQIKNFALMGLKRIVELLIIQLSYNTLIYFM